MNDMPLSDLLEIYTQQRETTRGAQNTFSLSIRRFGAAIGKASPTVADVTTANLLRAKDVLESQRLSVFVVNYTLSSLRGLRSFFCELSSRPVAMSIPPQEIDRSKPAYSLLTLVAEYGRTNRRVRCRKTIDTHLSSVRQLGEAIGSAVVTTHDLTEDNLVAMEKYLESRGRTIFTINGNVARIKALWTWAAKRRYVEHFPTSAKLVAPEPFRKAWTVDELNRLFAAAAHCPGHYGTVPASHFWLAWLRFGFETGERSGAMLAMTFGMLTERGMELPAAIRKCGKSAFYRISDELREMLLRLQRPGVDQIFAWQMSHSSFFLHHRRLNRLAGLPATGKDLSQRMRRTHLTWWSIGGEDATKRAKHSSPNVTQKHYLDETLLPAPDPTTVLPPVEMPLSLRAEFSDADSKQLHLIDWIRQRGGSTTAHAMVRHTLAGYKTAADARAALDELVAKGLGEWRERRHTGGRPTIDFVLFD